MSSTMAKTSFLFFFVSVLTVLVPTTQETISNTNLIGYEDYMIDVVRRFVHSLEDDGICNLRMEDFSMPISKSYYGTEVIGNLKFSNGFIIGMKKPMMYIKDSTDVAKFSLDNTSMTAWIHTNLKLNDLRLIYDLNADLESGQIKNKGIMPLDRVEYTISIVKNLATGEVTPEIAFSALAPEKRGRMTFLPSSSVTEIIGREVNSTIDVFLTTFRGWAKEGGFLATTLQKVVKEKGNFPEIDYDTFTQ